MKKKKLPKLKRALKSVKYFLGVDIDINVREMTETFSFSVAYKERDTTVIYQSATIVNKLKELKDKPSLKYIKELEAHFRTVAMNESTKQPAAKHSNFFSQYNLFN